MLRIFVKNQYNNIAFFSIDCSVNIISLCVVYLDQDYEFTMSHERYRKVNEKSFCRYISNGIMSKEFSRIFDGF